MVLGAVAGGAASRRFYESDAAAALRRRDVVLTVTAGRSGTKLLAVLLSRVLGVHAEHEPPPRANHALRDALADPASGLRWLVEEKFPAIIATGADPYVETSHLYCKGFIELLFSLGIGPRFIILRRDARAVATSLYRMNVIPSRTKDGRLVLLDPSDVGTLPFPDWERAGDYELCYWYALEIERRQARYRTIFERERIGFTELTLGELTNWDGFRRLCAFVAPARDPQPRYGLYEKLIAVDQHPRDVALPGAMDRALPHDIDERERSVRRSVGDVHRGEPDSPVDLTVMT